MFGCCRMVVWTEDAGYDWIVEKETGSLERTILESVTRLGE